MEVKIIETGEIEYLNAIDFATGVDWTQDLIGNHNGFIDPIDDGGFDYLEEEDVYLCQQDIYDWWNDIIFKLNYISEIEYNADGEFLEELKEYWGNDLEDEVEGKLQIIKEYIDEDYYA